MPSYLGSIRVPGIKLLRYGFQWAGAARTRNSVGLSAETNQTMDTLENVHWEDHCEGNRRCKQCSTGFPQPCGCGGIIHAVIVRIPGAGFIQLTRCDRCLQPRE